MCAYTHASDTNEDAQTTVTVQFEIVNFLVLIWLVNVVSVNVEGVLLRLIPIQKVTAYNDDVKMWILDISYMYISILYIYTQMYKGNFICGLSSGFQENRNQCFRNCIFFINLRLDF